MVQIAILQCVDDHLLDHVSHTLFWLLGSHTDSVGGYLRYLCHSCEPVQALFRLFLSSRFKCVLSFSCRHCNSQSHGYAWLYFWSVVLPSRHSIFEGIFIAVVTEAGLAKCSRTISSRSSTIPTRSSSVQRVFIVMTIDRSPAASAETRVYREGSAGISRMGIQI